MSTASMEEVLRGVLGRHFDSYGVDLVVRESGLLRLLEAGKQLRDSPNRKVSDTYGSREYDAALAYMQEKCHAK